MKLHNSYLARMTGRRWPHARASCVASDVADSILCYPQIFCSFFHCGRSLFRREADWRPIERAISANSFDQRKFDPRPRHGARPRRVRENGCNYANARPAKCCNFFDPKAAKRIRCFAIFPLERGTAHLVLLGNTAWFFIVTCQWTRSRTPAQRREQATWKTLFLFTRIIFSLPFGTASIISLALTRSFAGRGTK